MNRQKFLSNGQVTRYIMCLPEIACGLKYNDFGFWGIKIILSTNIMSLIPDYFFLRRRIETAPLGHHLNNKVINCLYILL